MIEPCRFSLYPLLTRIVISNRSQYTVLPILAASSEFRGAKPIRQFDSHSLIVDSEVRHLIVNASHWLSALKIQRKTRIRLHRTQVNANIVCQTLRGTAYIRRPAVAQTGGGIITFVGRLALTSVRCNRTCNQTWVLAPELDMPVEYTVSLSDGGLLYSCSTDSEPVARRRG